MIVVCDRFSDSDEVGTVPGFRGGGLGFEAGEGGVEYLIDCAVGGDAPGPPPLTRLLGSFAGNETRATEWPAAAVLVAPGAGPHEESRREVFFERWRRVRYRAIAGGRNHKRVSKRVDATGPVEAVGAEIWKHRPDVAGHSGYCLLKAL